jgi:hypothetical protein
MVIDCSSLYNCIIGRTSMTQLGAACSTVHLKLKYHAKNGTIATQHRDIEAARRCFLQANKNQSLVSLTEQSSKDKGKAVASILNSNMVELDSRFTKFDLKEQKKRWTHSTWKF